MSRIRDWAALAGAVAMVGFLTFVPQHHAVADRPERIVARDASIDWPP